jgi:tripartite ATP-independent transporter DctM subunit
MDIGIVTVILFASLLLLLVTGLPLVFGLGGVGLIIMYWQLGPKFLYVVAATAYNSWTNFILVAIPLFVFMANVLERSRVAEDLYAMMHRWMGPLRGGLAMGTVVICAIFAAMAGISGVATVTMGVIALPAMLDRHYDKQLAVGCISAGGTLGILIPPSIIMIIYGMLTGESVGQLFMGGFFPGIVLAGIFCAYIGIRSLLQPHLGPPIPVEERGTLKERLVSSRALILPVLLILLVLGVIYTGIATPTEASGVGAAGAVICTIVNGRFSWSSLFDASKRTLSLTAMILWIVFGAKVFSHAYIAIGAPDLVRDVIAALEVNRWVVIIIMQLILVVLGMFIDPMGIMMITTPVFLPIVHSLGFNLVWFGVLFTINMEIGYITPPFGFNLFYMRGIVPKEVSMADIYRSIWPFVILAGVGIGVVMVWPQLALWLPSTMIGG